MRIALAVGSAALAIAALASEARAQQPESLGGGQCSANIYNCPDTPNPLPAPNTVWIEEMTWMDVRDALDEGKTTAIIPTGGMEPNGPWLVTGKHNYVLRANCDAIARQLGDALCAPIVKLVPEGNIDPPSSHMTSPGTISMREQTFRGILTDVARSLKAHGFDRIIFIGDSGGNQGGQRAVAQTLNAEWGDDVIVAHVQEYYDYGSVSRYMEEQGLVETESDGLHDDAVITLNMFADDPSSVRYAERVEAGLATINGVSIADRVQSLEYARQIVAFRANHTVEAINSIVAAGGTMAPPAPPAGRGAAAGRGGGGRGGGAGGGRGRGGGGGGAAAAPAPRPASMGGGQCDANAYNCPDTPNPLPEAETLWIEEMTWMDVRDAVANGKTTVIISTGGMEPNGPWLVTGKHNYVLRANCPAIARDLGNALCAPVIELVPEGAHDPPSGHMRSHGTISLTEETYRAMLTDVAQSLKQHGFEDIVFIGDSGGNQNGMAAVAEELTAAWAGEAMAVHIREYYTAPPGTPNVLRELGEVVPGMPSDGLHDSPGITLNMMLDDPSSVRWAERVKTGQATINGFSIADLRHSLELAKQISDARASRTAVLIRDRIRR